MTVASGSQREQEQHGMGHRCGGGVGSCWHSVWQEAEICTRLRLGRSLAGLPAVCGGAVGGAGGRIIEIEIPIAIELELELELALAIALAMHERRNPMQNPLANSQE